MGCLRVGRRGLRSRGLQPEVREGVELGEERSRNVKIRGKEQQEVKQVAERGRTVERNRPAGAPAE